MTMFRAQIFFWGCILFGVATAAYVYNALDWSTVQIGPDNSSVHAVYTADIEFGPTLTAIAKFLTRTATPVVPTPTPPPLAAGGVTVSGVAYRVDAVSDPETAGLFKPPAGKRLVAVHVTVRAGSAALQYSFTQFLLADAAGKEYTWALGNSEPQFQQGSLPAGETRSGWLAFAVPMGVEPSVVLVQPVPAGPKIPIAALR